MRTTGLTYEDLLEMFPEEEKVRRELIDGELFVTPSPTLRHERVCMRLALAIGRYAQGHGGEAFVGVLDTMVSPADVVQPDAMYFDEETSRRLVERPLTEPPILAMEVSSPSTRTRDRTRKRDLYARFGVREYWFVDLKRDVVEVYRLEAAAYLDPIVLTRSDAWESPLLPGFRMSIAELLGDPKP